LQDRAPIAAHPPTSAPDLCGNCRGSGTVSSCAEERGRITGDDVPVGGMKMTAFGRVGLCATEAMDGRHSIGVVDGQTRVGAGASPGPPPCLGRVTTPRRRKLTASARNPLGAPLLSRLNSVTSRLGLRAPFVVKLAATNVCERLARTTGEFFKPVRRGVA
jgi:hypothetical protein